MARRDDFDEFNDFDDREELLDGGGGRKIFTPALGQRILKTLIIFGVLLAIFLILVMKVFVIKKVEVEGNKLYEDKLIEDVVLSDHYSWSTLLVYLKYRFKDTEKVPFIDTMEVTMTGPQSMKITVYEKGMMGYLYIPGINENAYFDKDGLVVETSSDIVPGIPEVKGIACNSVVLYEKLPIPDKTLRDILTLTQSLKREKLVPDAVVYEDADEPVAVYGKVRVRIGSTAFLTQKVERMARILPTLAGKAGILHLESWTEETSNIIFSEKKNSKKNK